jgi:hypothetical protein
MCPIPNGFRDRAISLYIFKMVDKEEILRTVSISWYISKMVAKEEILRTDSNPGIYCSSD